MLKILWKRAEFAPEEQFLLLSTIYCYLVLEFCVKTRIRCSLRDKRLFYITEVEISRVDCILNSLQRLKLSLSVRFRSLIYRLLPFVKESVSSSMSVLPDLNIHIRNTCIFKQTFVSFMHVTSFLILLFFNFVET